MVPAPSSSEPMVTAKKLGDEGLIIRRELNMITGQVQQPGLDPSPTPTELHSPAPAAGFLSTSDTRPRPMDSSAMDSSSGMVGHQQLHSSADAIKENVAPLKSIRPSTSPPSSPAPSELNSATSQDLATTQQATLHDAHSVDAAWQASTARHELPSPCIISPQKEPSPCNKNNTGISADSAAPGDQAISAEDGKAIMDSYVERTPSTAPYFSHFLSDRPAGRSPEPQRPCPDSKAPAGGSEAVEVRPQHQGRSSTSRGHLRSSTPSTNHSNSGGSSNGNAERGGRQRQRPYQDSQVNAAAQAQSLGSSFKQNKKHSSVPLESSLTSLLRIASSSGRKYRATGGAAGAAGSSGEPFIGTGDLLRALKTAGQVPVRKEPEPAFDLPPPNITSRRSSKARGDSSTSPMVSAGSPGVGPMDTLDLLGQDMGRGGGRGRGRNRGRQAGGSGAADFCGGKGERQVHREVQREAQREAEDSSGVLCMVTLAKEDAPADRPMETEGTSRGSEAVGAGGGGKAAAALGRGLGKGKLAGSDKGAKESERSSSLDLPEMISGRKKLPGRNKPGQRQRQRENCKQRRAEGAAQRSIKTAAAGSAIEPAPEAERSIKVLAAGSEAAARGRAGYEKLASELLLQASELTAELSSSSSSDWDVCYGVELPAPAGADEELLYDSGSSEALRVLPSKADKAYHLGSQAAAAPGPEAPSGAQPRLSAAMPAAAVDAQARRDSSSDNSGTAGSPALLRSAAQAPGIGGAALSAPPTQPASPASLASAHSLTGTMTAAPPDSAADAAADAAPAMAPVPLLAEVASYLEEKVWGHSSFAELLALAEGADPEAVEELRLLEQEVLAQNERLEQLSREHEQRTREATAWEEVALLMLRDLLQEGDTAVKEAKRGTEVVEELRGAVQWLQEEAQKQIRVQQGSSHRLAAAEKQHQRLQRHLHHARQAINDSLAAGEAALGSATKSVQAQKEEEAVLQDAIRQAQSEIEEAVQQETAGRSWEASRLLERLSSLQSSMEQIEEVAQAQQAAINSNATASGDTKQFLLRFELELQQTQARLLVRQEERRAISAASAAQRADLEKVAGKLPGLEEKHAQQVLWQQKLSEHLHVVSGKVAQLESSQAISSAQLRAELADTEKQLQQQLARDAHKAAVQVEHLLGLLDQLNKQPGDTEVLGQALVYLAVVRCSSASRDLLVSSLRDRKDAQLGAFTAAVMADTEVDSSRALLFLAAQHPRKLVLLIKTSTAQTSGMVGEAQTWEQKALAALRSDREERAEALRASRQQLQAISSSGAAGSSSALPVQQAVQAGARKPAEKEAWHKTIGRLLGLCK